MAILHTDLPRDVEGHHQEYRFGRKLSAIDDSRLHLWFSLSYMKGVKDIDILICHEDVGVFVVEVKGVPITAIEEYGLKAIVITGRPRQMTPVMQAQEAMYSLKRYLRNPPFLTPTACWPLITRSEWCRRWLDPRIADLAPSMLFADDFEGGPRALHQRLLEIRETPPIGEAVARGTVRSTVVADLNAGLNVNARPTLTRTDLQRLQIIESTVRREIRKEFPVGKQHAVVFQGHPGTGKTFRLLQLAYGYVEADREALFLCFNKVLASDLRRLLSFSSSLPKYRASIHVFDIYDFLSPWASQYGVSGMDGDYDEWATLVVATIKEDASQEVAKYSAVFVDEAQDMPEWAWDLFSLFLEPDGSIFVAAGKGQELYGAAPAWLRDFSAKSTSRRLNRNFRNSRPTFMVAQGFYEVSPDSNAIAPFLRRFTGSRQAGFEFDRESGQPQRLRRIEDRDLWLEPVDSPFFPDIQDEVMVRELKLVIEEEIESLEREGSPRTDLMCLVPDRVGAAARWVRDALRVLNVDYIDYTDDERRRSFAKNEQVRLCTYHSARGVEALRVLLIGIERIEDVAQKTSADPRHLGYIVLSRGLLSTTVVRTAQTTPSADFLDSLIAEVAIAQARSS
jgi:hypothetical protein